MAVLELLWSESSVKLNSSAGSLRKQPAFCNATTGFLTGFSLQNILTHEKIWLLGDVRFVFSAEKYFTHSHCSKIQKTFHILAQTCNILSINTCTSQQYHKDLQVFTRIMTTNPMSRNTSTTELIMDNQWIWKVSNACKI